MDAVKREIDAYEREIDEVEARVEELEERKKKEGHLDDDDKKELEHKRDIYGKLLDNLCELRKEKARLEQRSKGVESVTANLQLLSLEPKVIRTEVPVNEVDAVKRKIDALEREIDALERKIDKVEARVEELEERKRNQGCLDDDDKKELVHKRDIYSKLLDNLSELRKEKARLEERQQGVAGTSF